MANYLLTNVKPLLFGDVLITDWQDCSKMLFSSELFQSGIGEERKIVDRPARNRNRKRAL